MALRFGSMFVTPSLRPRLLPVQLKHFRFVTVAFRLSGCAVNNFLDQGNFEAMKTLIVVGKLHAVMSINFVLKLR